MGWWILPLRSDCGREKHPKNDKGKFPGLTVISWEQSGGRGSFVVKREGEESRDNGTSAKEYKEID